MTLGRFCSLAGLGSSLVLAAVACSTTSSTSSTASNLPECNSPDFDGYPLGIRCNALVDETGRRVQLHGVNARVQGLFDVSFDDGRVPLHAVPDFTDDDAKRMRELGFDSVRLPINWSGLEPTEGDGFNQAYLVRLDAILAICKRWNLLVLLSLHQDGYSKEIGQDGAPLWAIRPAPDQLLEGPLGDGLEQRNLSAQVARAFVTFFGPSSEGAYLRQRFIAMAAFVLRRYADEPAVLGLDIFNEPVSSDTQSLAFFRQAIPELRSAAPRKLLFFQPAGIRNLTDYASDGNGSLGAGTVYAPHIYTAVFDRDETRRLNLKGDDLRPSYRRAREEASSHQAPLAVGEYGYFPTAANYEEYIRGAFRAQDEVFASSFFWVWKENSQSQWGFFDYDPIQKQWSERPDVLRMHARPFASRLAGRLMETEYDAKEARLRLRFLGDPNVSAPNLVTVGDMAEFRNRKARAQCDGAALALEGDRVFQVPCHGAGEHEITFGPDR